MKKPLCVLLAVGTGLLAMCNAAEDPKAHEKVACPVGEFTCGHENIEWTTSYAFHMNDGRKSLPRVLLVGDSICNGYQSQVMQLLGNKMNATYWASSYCVTSPVYLKLLDIYLSEAKYDVVHFNSGCHSLATPTEAWQAGVRAAFKLIRERQPKAKIIWCTTTPNRNDKTNGDVQRLNAAAKPLAAEFCVSVTDLYAAMDKLDPTHKSAKVWSDNYHFKPSAIKLQAEAVARSVLSTLPAK